MNKQATPLKGSFLARGTLLSRDLDRVAEFCEAELGLEAARLAPDRLALRDREGGDGVDPFWTLEVTAVAEIECPQNVLNHWGVTVATKEEVDEAFARITAKREHYGLTQVSTPQGKYGSYSFYVGDADSNWWELGFFEPGYGYEDLVEMSEEDKAR